MTKISELTNSHDYPLRARCLKVAKAAVDKEYQTIITETKHK
jgi:hypothetical protein